VETDFLKRVFNYYGFLKKNIKDSMMRQGSYFFSCRKRKGPGRIPALLYGQLLYMSYGEQGTD